MTPHEAGAWAMVAAGWALVVALWAIVGVGIWNWIENSRIQARINAILRKGADDK